MTKDLLSMREIRQLIVMGKRLYEVLLTATSWPVSADS